MHATTFKGLIEAEIRLAKEGKLAVDETPEYRKGFIDGLRGALNLIELLSVRRKRTKEARYG